MVKEAEIYIKGKNLVKIQESPEEIKVFGKYLLEKYPNWEEFFISNNPKGELVVVKTESSLITLPRTLKIANLLIYIDRYYPGWNRFAMTNRSYKVLNYEDCEPNMITRASSRMTNQYVFIQEKVVNADGEIELICNQEGEKVVFNTANRESFKYKLVCKEAEFENFDAVSW